MIIQREGRNLLLGVTMEINLGIICKFTTKECQMGITLSVCVYL